MDRKQPGSAARNLAAHRRRVIILHATANRWTVHVRVIDGPSPRPARTHESIHLTGETRGMSTTLANFVPAGASTLTRRSRRAKVQADHVFEAA
jgi:hypothetical protein